MVAVSMGNAQQTDGKSPEVLNKHALTNLLPERLRSDDVDGLAIHLDFLDTFAACRVVTT